MEKKPVLYRRRLIPDECILLDKDRIVAATEEYMVTAWNTIRPKAKLHHGVSVFFWKRGVKVSKFYDHEGELICWYCDIITHEYDAQENSYKVIDLLADVLIYPDGSVRVVDLDELAEASEKGLLDTVMMQKALRQLNWLLQEIYCGRFKEMQELLEQCEPYN